MTRFILLLFLPSCFLDPEVRVLRAQERSELPALSPGADAGTVSFARDIRPLLAREDATPGGCRPCHYAGEVGAVGFQATQLDVTTLGALRKGGTGSRGQIIVPGNPDASVLVQKLEGTAVGGRMPLGRRAWSPEAIATLRRWISEGAVGSDDE